jgi:uncharacterized protein with HEPN domain
MRHMLDYAREARAMVDGRNRHDLDTDRMLQLALTHLVEIIGEAANRVSPEGRSRHPYSPWRDAIDTRNRFIHGYDSVDYDVVFLTCAGGGEDHPRQATGALRPGDEAFALQPAWRAWSLKTHVPL